MFFSLNFLLFLLFITATNSRPNNHHANEPNDTLPMILTADSSNVAIPNGDDVQLIGPGTVNLTLSSDILDVKIDLNNCYGRVKFCYSSLENNHEAALNCGNGFCGFQVEGSDETKIDVMEMKNVRKTNLDNPCLPVRMKQTETSYCGIYAASCVPFIIGKDKRITINVEKVSPTCPILIKNAEIYYPPPTTPASLLSKESAAQTVTSEASNEWYIWVIIGVALLLLIGIIIAVKTEAKKRTTITDTVDSQIVTKAEDAPEPKLESKLETQPKTPAEKIIRPPEAAKKSKKKSKKSKKGKKQKKSVKKDTVNDPVPPETPVIDAANLVTTSKEPDSVAPPPPPQFNSSVPPLKGLTQEQALDGDYYTPKTIKWLKSRSSKSDTSNRKSIVPPPVIIKTVVMNLEPHYSSLQRWKKSAMEDVKWKELEQHYKVDPAKKPLDVEISLLSGYIGDIFTTINRLIQESQTTLKEKGAQFRRNGKAKKFPASVYEFLKDSKTPEYTRYTAMGSEIGKGVFVDETRFEQYSLSALLLIGFTTSIPDKRRRHALAVLRRKLPKLRQRISVEVRKEYGYPANAIEPAFKHDSRLFENVEAIKTDSTKNLSEVTQD